MSHVQCHLLLFALCSMRSHYSSVSGGWWCRSVVVPPHVAILNTAAVATITYFTHHCKNAATFIIVCALCCVQCTVAYRAVGWVAAQPETRYICLEQFSRTQTQKQFLFVEYVDDCERNAFYEQIRILFLYHFWNMYGIYVAIYSVYMYNAHFDVWKCYYFSARSTHTHTHA